MLRLIEEAGIPTVQVGSVPSMPAQVGIPRYVRGWGVPHPWGNPWISKDQELELRRATLAKALEALTTTPAQPTVFWPEFGNVVGKVYSVGNPTTDELIPDLGLAPEATAQK